MLWSSLRTEQVASVNTHNCFYRTLTWLPSSLCRKGTFWHIFCAKSIANLLLCRTKVRIWMEWTPVILPKFLTSMTALMLSEITGSQKLNQTLCYSFLIERGKKKSLPLLLLSQLHSEHFSFFSPEHFKCNHTWEELPGVHSTDAERWPYTYNNLVILIVLSL